jgi:hypothetical protein
MWCGLSFTRKAIVLQRMIEGGDGKKRGFVQSFFDNGVPEQGIPRAAGTVGADGGSERPTVFPAL